jgi:hypothetical protein
MALAGADERQGLIYLYYHEAFPVVVDKPQDRDSCGTSNFPNGSAEKRKTWRDGSNTRLYV